MFICQVPRKLGVHSFLFLLQIYFKHTYLNDHLGNHCEKLSVFCSERAVTLLTLMSPCFYMCALRISPSPQVRVKKNCDSLTKAKNTGISKTLQFLQNHLTYIIVLDAQNSSMRKAEQLLLPFPK